MKKVAVLGSTGSIGCNALEVLYEQRNTHGACALACHMNDRLLLEQANRFKPEALAVIDPEAGGRLEDHLNGSEIAVFKGTGSLCKLIELTDPDIVLVAVSGAAGLLPSLATVEQGRRLALANKESLVMAGHLIKEAAAISKAEIIPVDSEHSAVFQAIRGEDLASIRRIFLTASGGPFVDLPGSALKDVTPQEAMKHPTWEMGTKITIDSATMMNKALEIIEARWLFDLSVDQIEVVVHRQSIVHSMVEFNDGSILAQMGTPDMKVPIQFALTYPTRNASNRHYFNLADWSRLTFESPDLERFPALGMGFEAAREGGLAGTALNAANEVAVDLFLKGSIKFVEITSCVRRVMDRLENKANPRLDEILATDRWAREEAIKWS
ncbi:MAG: 1-deoxy-D-xylulose-5-phosphate reductoisomerase [Planctomycetes bacterium]|nr:1-deoxy-D-xylulose-5-phosphate reductoisomerase [Planctomycetota bacterium]